MTYVYEKCPKKIEQQSFEHIRRVTNLSGFTLLEQQVVMRIVHSVGDPQISQQLRFSENACQNGVSALTLNNPILCDTQMVKQGITKRFLNNEPLCFLDDPQVQASAKNTGETRTMAALEQWQTCIKDSVVIIGNAPTALFRLLEMLEQGCGNPALIIAMPVGFIGAAQSKQALWDAHQSLGVSCITLLGLQGGSAVAAACCNALLRSIHGENY